jgi:hypothetical protein
MQDTGTYIYNTLLSDISRRPLKFRFLSDTVQRDADSALALQNGLALAYFAHQNTNGTLFSSHLHVTEYVPQLFHPFDATSMSLTPLCSLQATRTQWLQEIQTRLNTIPPPSLSMLDTLKLLQLVNENDPQSLHDTNHRPTLTFDVNNGPRLSGMINVIKLAVQTLFYSRASGIVSLVFLHRITNAQIYQQLLPWVHYSRSILNVGTTEAASRGAVLLRTMVDALTNEEALSDTVSLMVGHDTDLDAVATALNVVWAFDAPYYTDESRIDWYATPPGSAIYITHEEVEKDGGGVVTLSYLYPVFNLDDGTIRSWELIPLQLRNASTGVRTNDNTTTLAWTQFQEQLYSTLQRYKGAMECYNRAASGNMAFPPPNDNILSNSASIVVTASWSSFGGGFGTGVAVSIALVFLSWLYKYRRQRRLRSLYGTANSVDLNEDYDPVSGAVPKEGLT